MQQKIFSPSRIAPFLAGAVILSPLVAGAQKVVTEKPAATAAVSVGPLLDALSEAVRVVQDKGLPYDADKARRVVVQSLLQASDPAGKLFTDEQHRRMSDSQRGLFFSPGVEIERTNGVFTVKSVHPGTMAQEKGVQAGDTLLEIGGEGVDALSYARALDLLRGEGDEDVAVKVLSADGSTNELVLARQRLQAPAVDIQEELPANLCYVRLNGLYKGAGRVLADTIRKWHDDGRYGVVIDLRGANGLDVDSVTEVASLFAAEGALLFSFRDRDDQDLSVHKSEAGSQVDMPAIVLIDANTSGAAEVLASVFRGSTRGAMLLGRPSRGDMLVRDIVPLSGGHKMYISTSRLVLADGSVYDGSEGIEPDILLRKVDAAVDEYEPEPGSRGNLLKEEEMNLRLRERVRRDPTLRRATDLLLGLKALNIRTVGSSSNTSS